MSAAVSFDDVRAAAARLDGVVRRTPVLAATSVDRLVGAQVFIKCENLQRAGAFKFRGAFNAVSQLSDDQRRAGVVTFSSGNHGQALALAARLCGTRAAVVMPRDAPATKISATEAYGAEVIFYDRLHEDREAIARRVAAERGLTLIPPFEHPHVIAGQGTAAKELFEEVGPLEYLAVPLGGGGLLAGSALAATALAPSCKVVGVEPERGNDGQQSLRNGRIVEIAVPDTIADGARTVALGRLNFDIIKGAVHDIVTVSDVELVDTMRVAFERLKLVVEPTGALGIAAVLNHRIPAQGKRVGVVLSGGNVDAATFATLFAK